MNLDDTPQEAEFRREVSDWLAEHAPAYEQKYRIMSTMTAEQEGAKAWQAHKARHGYGAIHWPREHGGRGASLIETVIFQQEEAQYELPVGANLRMGLSMAAPTLFAHGTPEQIEALVGATLHGEITWCQLFSEPAAGSDLAGLRTRAEKDGDHWVINGQKVWNSWANLSDYAILIARNDFTRPKHAGLTYFVLDMKTPGIDARPIRQMSGGSGFCEVFLTDVRIHERWQVGEVNDGWNVVMTTLSNERMTSRGGTDAIRVADLIALARQATIGGRPAIDDHHVQERLAYFFAQENGLKLFNQRVETRLSHGETLGVQGSVNKLLGPSQRQQMADFGLELYGALGAVADDELAPRQSRIHRLLVFSAANRIAGGSDEIMRNQIAERILRLPPEARLDKGIPFNEI